MKQFIIGNISWFYLSGHASPFVAKLSMKLDNETFFVIGERAFFEIRPEVIGPTKTAAFAAASKACVFLKGVPISFTVLSNVGRKYLIFCRCPWPFLQCNSSSSIWYVIGRSTIIPCSYSVQDHRFHSVFRPSATAAFVRDLRKVRPTEWSSPRLGLGEIFSDPLLFTVSSVRNDDREG